MKPVSVPFAPVIGWINSTTIMASAQGKAEDRVIVFGEGLPAIPERLLLAHARGEVLFICGAGISRSAGLPGFRKLVVDVYQALDHNVYGVIKDLPRDACDRWEPEWSGLNSQQKAEVQRFIVGDYDVALGMLERRLDDRTRQDSRVREVVDSILRGGAKKPEAIHRALVRLADRGGTTTIVTTNFDRLLEAAARRCRIRVGSYSLGAIPRPSLRPHFEGVLHVHGVLGARQDPSSEIVLSDQDFGEFYLRRRLVPDFIYDASRLFNLVLIGYSANDPPMRYLLNAVAADGTRFQDIKERFSFIRAGSRDEIAVEDWKARGITPIPYESDGQHLALSRALQEWARLSPNSGTTRAMDAKVRGLVKKKRDEASEEEQDLFDHLTRRSDAIELKRLSELASRADADMGWLKAIMDVSGEKTEGHGT